MFKHIKEKQTSYIQHFKFAAGAGIVLIKAGIASLIHAIFPDVFTSYAFKKTKALARLASRGRYNSNSKQ
jgi:hypothetical protein